MNEVTPIFSNIGELTDHFFDKVDEVRKEIKVKQLDKEQQRILIVETREYIRQLFKDYTVEPKPYLDHYDKLLGLKCPE